MRATKIIQKVRHVSYEIHQKECGLTTLETRKLRGYQIKILDGHENIDEVFLCRLRKREGLEDMDLH